MAIKVGTEVRIKVGKLKDFRLTVVRTAEGCDMVNVLVPIGDKGKEWAYHVDELEEIEKTEAD